MKIFKIAFGTENLFGMRDVISIVGRVYFRMHPVAELSEWRES